MVLTAKPDRVRLWGHGLDDGLVLAVPFINGFRDESRIGWGISPPADPSEIVWTQDELGPVADFQDDQNGALQIPGLQTVFDGAFGATLSAIVNVDDMNDDQRVFGAFNTAPNASFLCYADAAATDTWRIVAQVDGGTRSTATNSANGEVTPGTYQHVVMRLRAGGEASVWVDGIEEQTTTWSATATGLVSTKFQQLPIGSASVTSATESEHFDGRISDFRGWNRYLHDEEIVALTADPWRQYVAPRRYVFGYDQPATGTRRYSGMRGINRMGA